MSFNNALLSDLSQSEISPSLTGTNLNSIILPLFSRRRRSRRRRRKRRRRLRRGGQ